MLVGLQASGKSTFARSLAGTHVVVSKDDWPHARRRQQRQMRLIGEALAGGRNVVVDNTNPSPAEWQPLIEAGRQYGATVVAYWFPPDPSASVERNAQRQGQARVPEVGLFTTLKLLRRPTPGEGFDAVFEVRFDGAGGFTVTPGS